jgi:hypothetical protein
MNHPYFPASGRRPLRTTSQLLPLEQRFMFDGAVADAVHAAQAHDSAPPPVPPAVTVRAAEPARDEGKKEVVLVDTSLANHKSLEAGVRDGVGIVEFDGSRDGLAQIAQWAASQSGLDAIHILSHGSQGLVNLGTAQLTEASLSSSTTRAELAQLGQALTMDGDLLLYGCEVGAGKGWQLLAGLAQATGADVAASTDMTGAARLGGDWTLEAHSGAIDVRELAINQYDGLLINVPFDGTEVAYDFSDTTITKSVSDVDVKFQSAQMGYDAGGIYPLDGNVNGSDTKLVITIASGYTFDLTSVKALVYDDGQVITFTVTYANGSSIDVPVTVADHTQRTTISGIILSTLNDATRIVIASPKYISLQDFDISDVKAINPPTTTVSNANLAPDTGIDIHDFITNNAAQTISGTLSTSLAALERVEVSFDNGSTWSNATHYTIGQSNWSTTTTLVGNGTFQARVTNNAGSSTAWTHNYTLDTTAPATSVDTAAFSNDSGTSSSDFITNTAAQTISGTLSANLASGETVFVSLNNGSTWLAATAVVGTNTWSLAGQTLAASNTLKVKVSDTAGNDGAILSQAYVLDTTAPTISFSAVALSADTGTSNTDFITNTAAQTISATLSGALAGSDILYGSLDNGATWTDITSKVSGTTLTWNGVTLAGSNTLKFKVTDVASNDGTAHSQAYVLDTSTPSTPGTPVLASASDSGASNSDGITSDTTPTFTGTADNGSTVSIYDGATFLGSVVAGAGGWSFTSGTLGSGSHTITAVASDAAGNTSATSGALSITVDNVSPATTSVAVPSDGTYFVGQQLDFTVNFDEAVTVDTSGGTPRIALVVGATTHYADYISGSGSSVLVFRYVVANGDADSNGITVGALSLNGGSLKDTAGNDATVTLNSVGSTAGVDVDGSQASITGVSASTANGSYGAGQTITITIDFSGAVTVGTTGGTPTLALASGGSATYSSGSGSSTLIFTYTIAAGQNSADLDYSSAAALALNGATIVETGGAHQAAAVTLATPGTAGSLGANKDIVIDTTAPTTTVASAAFSADSGTSASDFITKVAAQTISGTLSANVASDESVYVSLDNGATWTLATSTVGANTWSLAGQTLTGSGTLKVRVTDAAGNNGVAYSQAYVLDTSAPSAPGTPVLDSASDSGASNSDGITSDTTPTFTGSADIGSIVSIYDGATFLGTAVAGAGGWSFTSGTLGSGSHAITAVASDTAGNTSVASSALSITIDNVAPTTTSVAVPASGTYYTGQPMDFTVNFDEAVTVDTGGGTPRIALVIGATTHYADYVSGSGSGALVFRYVVANGDADSNGITVGALSLNGGSLKDTAGNNATVTLNSIGSTAGVDVDGSLASITGVSSSTANGSYGVGQTITITVAFSGAVTVDTTGGTPTLALASGGSATYSGGSGSSTLSFTYTVGAGQNSADLDYSSAAALALNGATIIETGGSHQAALVTLATPGAAGSLGANKDIVIDTTAPATTVASAAFSADSGTSASDFITNIAAQTVSGTLSANVASDESVYVSLDNGATWTLATTTVGANTWSLAGQTLTGSGTLKVKVSDAAGNDGAVYSQAYVLDNTAPTISFSGLALSADTGTAGDFITNTAAQTISATLSVAPAGGDKVYGSLDNGGTWIDITGMVSGSTLTWTGVTLAASNTLQLKVTDAAGNDGAATTQAYTLDTTGPATSVASASFSADSGSSASDLITRIAGQTVSGTLSANLAAGETVYVSLDNGVTWQAASGSVGSAAWTLAGQTLTGSSTLQVKVSDNAGNDSAVYTRAYVFDTTAPAAATVTPLTTDSLTPTLGGSATFAAGDSMTVTVGGATYIVTPVDGSWSLDLSTAEPASGTLTLALNHLYSVVATITDAAGNSASNSSSGELIVGSITPPTTAITGVALSGDSGSSAADFITNVAAQTVGGTLSAPLAPGQTVEVSFDGGATWQGTGAGAGASAWSIGATLGGSNVFMARVSSDSGKGPVFQHAYTLDTVAPIASPTSASLSGANVLSGVLSAPLGEGESVLVSRDGGVNWVQASASGDSWSLAGVSVGTVQVQVRDAAGNTGSILTVEAITQLVPPVVPEIPLVPLKPAYEPPVVADARPAAILPQAPVSPLSAPVLQSVTNSATLLNAFTPNDTPELSRGYDGLLAYRPIADVNVRAGERISVQLPPDTFVTSGNPRVVQLSALSMDGKALPSWLKFDSTTARFEGTPPPGFEGTLSFKVMARDSRGHVAVQVFKIVVAKDGHAVKTTAIDGHVADPAGRSGLSEQMRSVRGAGADRLAALSRSAAVARGHV